MRDNRLPGVLAREKHKPEAFTSTARYGSFGGTGQPARPWLDNRGHWPAGTDRKSAVAVRNMTRGVAGAR